MTTYEVVDEGGSGCKRPNSAKQRYVSELNDHLDVISEKTIFRQNTFLPQPPQQLPLVLIISILEYDSPLAMIRDFLDGFREVGFEEWETNFEECAADLARQCVGDELIVESCRVDCVSRG